ncbi:MarR family transcriptional regulator [Sphingomonas donggukensis]|uniref:MarR family transcriptional regulator n=1 Tax=Sphingomonas donggukensis TaxID=2949093 RepID=A0ABY4TVR9_9SPHN|nr:MarR family transcriptional regulator [Sphingomonas donggukensis]URW74646.1 MarR family transcriptional regulator [Sphingomonas donggukensis]
MKIEDDRPQLDFVRECVLLGRKWRSHMDERLRPGGLTLARATVLYWIDALPGLVTQRELADMVGIEGPTLVRQLHALEAQGLVERVPFEGDRRAKGLRLTDAAKPYLGQLQAVADGLCAEKLDRLETRRLSSATRLIREARLALE